MYSRCLKKSKACILKLVPSGPRGLVTTDISSKPINGTYFFPFSVLQQEFIDLTHPGDTKSCDAKPSLRFTPYGKNLDSGYLKHGVVHQILSPISNYESTNFFNEYYLGFLFQLAN